jgi:hypothetical protein
MAQSASGLASRSSVSLSLPLSLGMDSSQIEKIKAALTILENYVCGNTDNLPNDLKQRVETCLTKLSAAPRDKAPIAPSNVSSREDPSNTEAGLPKKSFKKPQRSKRKAGHPWSSEASGGRESSRKRNKRTHSELQERINSLREAFKARICEIEELIKSDPASVIHSLTLDSLTLDPREADVCRPEKPTTIELLKRLLAIRSLCKDLEDINERKTKRKNNRKNNGEESASEQLATKLGFKTITIVHCQTWGNKSQSFINACGRSGILWFMVFEFRKCRYFPEDGVIEIGRHIRKDEDMFRLVTSISEYWTLCENAYEDAVRRRKYMGLLLKEVDDTGGGSGFQALTQNGET